VMEDRLGGQRGVDFEDAFLEAGQGWGAAAPWGVRVFAPEMRVQQKAPVAKRGEPEGKALRALKADTSRVAWSRAMRLSLGSRLKQCPW
jgi:hypothetical protein